MAQSTGGSLGELARLFLRLGLTAFGGPAAHIALLHNEVVNRRGWMTEADFLDLLGATNLIPGPNSTEMAIHIGYRRAGWKGLLLAGLCFLLPAALLSSACAWAYLRFGKLPAAAGLLHALKPVVVAVILSAMIGLAKAAWHNASLLALAGVDPLPLLFGAGAVAATVRWASRPKPGERRPPAASLWLMVLVAAAIVVLPLAVTRLAGGATAEARAVPFGLTPLFVFFLKIGSVLYGSGYVLLAFLRDGLVNRWHWLTNAQLLDAVAVGQITPGPVFTTATFIGYILAGPVGAAVATAGIFLPSFVFVAISGPIVPRLRRSPMTGAFLNGVNAAALALLAAVTWELGRSALVDRAAVLLAAASAALLLRYKVNPAWLILAAAAIGLLWPGPLFR
jgi:chromate transporter